MTRFLASPPAALALLLVGGGSGGSLDDTPVQQATAAVAVTDRDGVPAPRYDAARHGTVTGTGNAVPAPDGIVQTEVVSTPGTGIFTGIFSTPTDWNGRLDIGTVNDQATATTLATRLWSGDADGVRAAALRRAAVVWRR